MGLLILPAAGCVEPDLGDIPFRCNNGTPACPEGYLCVQRGSEVLCVREGYSFPDTSAGPDAGSEQDSGYTAQADSRPAPDRAPLPDMFVTKWDLGPTDAKLDAPAKQDSGESPVLCQSNNDCISPDAPCCCPMPLLPIFSVCLAFCLDPPCLPL